MRASKVRDRCGPPSEEARRERGIIRQVLAERAEPAILAARLASPSHGVKELGKRPSDPEKAKAWDKGVRAIESYRGEHGIKDKDNALGHWRGGGQDRSARDHAQDRVREAQRRLERTQRQERTMQRSREMSHGFDISI